MTTIETVTESQIRNLRTSAGQAGDLVQVEICDIALGHWSDQPPEDDERDVIAKALAECVRVIVDAEE